MMRDQGDPISDNDKLVKSETSHSFNQAHDWTPIDNNRAEGSEGGDRSAPRRVATDAMIDATPVVSCV